MPKFKSNDVYLRKLGFNTDRWSKFVLNFNPEGLVLKIVRGFLVWLFVTLPFSCLVCLSKFYRFRKTEFPHILSRESSDQISRQFVKYLINLFKEGTFVEKKKAGFFFLHSKFWMGNHMWINVSIWENAHLPSPTWTLTISCHQLTVVGSLEG